MRGRKSRVIIAFVLMFSLFVQSQTTVYAGSLKEAQEEKEKLESALEDAHKLVEELKGSKTDIQQKVRQLDAQLTDISTDIANLESELEDKNLEIEDTKKVLGEAEADAKEQYERMKLRIRYMYENSMGTYMQRLLSAQSFSEFLGTAEYIRQITQYDRDMLEKYQNTQMKVADTKNTLEQEKAELQEMQAKVEKDKQAVSVLLSAKESELTAVSSDLNKANSEADAVEAEIQAQEEIIAQIQAIEAAKQAAKKAAEEAARKAAEEAAAAEQNSTEEPTGADTQTPTEIPDDSYNGGAFLWPCPASTRVTSDYGNRVSPTAGASSNHKGIDIGAPYGADIVAVADGEVTFAGYSNGAGNYVMVDHGGSLYTVYMHASTLCVSKGDKVTRGTVIAKVGSTGISTGNHLHFGVSLNGAYVSPWNYLSR